LTTQLLQPPRLCRGRPADSPVAYSKDHRRLLRGLTVCGVSTDNDKNDSETAKCLSHLVRSFTGVVQHAGLSVISY